jgi:Domain of unknown function (DUF4180)
MEFNLHESDKVKIAEITSPSPPLQTAEDFLDLMANTRCQKIIVPKALIDEAFFDLRSGVAGEILQKASTYSIQLAVVGDFTHYEGRSLGDFIYESNQANQVLFVDTVATAVERFSE